MVKYPTGQGTFHIKLHEMVTCDVHKIILGRVRLGSIRNKSDWNKARKRLFGSYSHSGIPGFPFYSAPWSRIAEIYSGIYSYSRISQTNAFLVKRGGGGVKELVPTSIICTIHLAANSGLCPQFLCGSF